MEATVAAMEPQTLVEGGPERLGGQRLVDRPRGDGPAVPKEQRMAEPAGDLLDVVGDEDDPPRPRIAGEGLQRAPFGDFSTRRFTPISTSALLLRLLRSSRSSARRSWAWSLAS